MNLSMTFDSFNLNNTQRDIIEKSFAQNANRSIKTNSNKKMSINDSNNYEIMTFSNGLSIKYRFIITYANPNEDY